MGISYFSDTWGWESFLFLVMVVVDDLVVVVYSPYVLSSHQLIALVFVIKTLVWITYHEGSTCYGITKSQTNFDETPATTLLQTRNRTAVVKIYGNLWISKIKKYIWTNFFLRILNKFYNMYWIFLWYSMHIIGFV